MKKSEMIDAAKSYIANGQERYVCLALDRVSRNFLASSPELVQQVGSTARALQDWIFEDLFHKNYAFYGDWLYEHDHQLYAKGFGTFFKEARLQWMDWMIQYWQEKGE